MSRSKSQPTRLTRELVIATIGCAYCAAPVGLKCRMWNQVPKIEPHRVRYLHARERLGLFSKRSPMLTDSEHVNTYPQEA